MSKVEKGTKFEKIVEKVLKWMYSKYENVKIEHNVFINSPDTRRQIDILITVVVRDLIFKVAVECKDYKGRLSIGKVDEFVSKLRDIGASKGIMISSNGFASSSISKAKREGIILYSLTDKIQHDDKELDIPVIIKEIIPYEMEVEFSVKKENGQTMKGETLIRDPLVINGYNIEDILKSKWESQTLPYNLTTDFQSIKIPEIVPPYKCRYYINEKNNITDEVELSTFNTKFKLIINYYTISLKELIGLNVLENIHENKLEMFIDKNTILSSLPNAKAATKVFVDNFKGLKAIFLINGKFNIKLFGGF